MLGETISTTVGDSLTYSLKCIKVHATSGCFAFFCIHAEIENAEHFAVTYHREECDIPASQYFDTNCQIQTHTWALKEINLEKIQLKFWSNIDFLSASDI